MDTILQKKCSAEPDYNKVHELSEKLCLHEKLIELLFSRGINSESDIVNFFNPDKSLLYDPFLMKGMKEAVARLSAAIKNKERIIVYGDYDVDGVCSSAIFALFFASKGLDVFVHIPNRSDGGYGLNVKSIETLIDKHCPDLILTCDCGISGVAEVEHCLDLGVDIIVTDHHEAGDTIPECVVVNPKQEGDTYPDKYLCGAGVAFKVVQALCGDESYLEFLDLAAVATIADLVPLLKENRLIVQLGLEQLNSTNCNIGLKSLLKSQGLNGMVSSADIAYRIAPRINAAGRMGDAYRAFSLLISTEDEVIKCIIAEIDADNDKRKEMCDKAYNEATVDLTFEDIVNNRAIVLSNSEWSKGITGIVAARFAGDYNRPTFIIVDKSPNGLYKGTARGIAGTNVYDALAYCSELLPEYGGHSGAAGFSVYEKDIDKFKEKMNEYFCSLPEKTFLPTAFYDIEIEPSEINTELLNAMAKIEPTGNSNTKPIFKLIGESVKITPCKNANHTSVKIGNLQLFAFNYSAKNQYLLGDDKKEIVFELTEGFNGGVSGHIKAVSPSQIYINDAIALANYFSSISIKLDGNPKYLTYSADNFDSIMPDNIYGTLVICADRNSYNRVIANNNVEKLVMHDYMVRSEKNNYSGVIVSPIIDDKFNVANYERIIFADSPVSDDVISYLNSQTKADIYVPNNSNLKQLLSGVVLDRNVFASYYEVIKNNINLAASNVITFYKRISAMFTQLSALQFVVCYSVFFELGFIALEGNKYVINSLIHKPLSESAIYNRLCEILK